MNLFHKRLRSLRQQYNLTLEQLGKAIGMSKSSINMYERGEREPSFETLEMLADYFNVDLDYLLGKSDVPNRAPINPDSFQIADKCHPLDPDVQELATQIQQLDAEDRAEIRGEVRGMLRAEKYKQDAADTA